MAWFPCNVGGSSDIEEEYFSCAYMGGTGIILPFSLNADYKVTVKFFEGTYVNDSAIIGNTNGASYSHLTEYNNKWFTSSGTAETNFGSWIGNTEHTFINNNGNGKNEFDGTEVTNYTGYTNNSIYYTIGCRGNNVTSNRFYDFIKHYKIESISTGDVICELVPCKITRNGSLLIQGLMDIVNNKMYTTPTMVVSNTH